MRLRTLAILAVLLLALALAGCCAAPVPSGPAGVVQKALELRRDRVTDAARYTPLFSDATIGAQLAKDSEAATQAPVPAWSTPYISQEASSSADVVVVWSRGTEPRFKDWPKATLFTLQSAKGVWVIADAQEVTGTVPPAR
jgi:hypothetical protein